LGSRKKKNIPSDLFQHFKSQLNINEIQELHDNFIQGDRIALESSKPFIEAKKLLNIDENNLYAWLDIMTRELAPFNLYSEQLLTARDTIQTEFPFDLIYLPTYRRIEEDLKILGEQIPNRLHDRNVIQFGMSDVRARFTDITSEIKNSSIRWFAKVNGQMLTQLIQGVNVDNDMKDRLGHPEALKIVLDRVGSHITDKNKEHIINLVANKSILDNTALSYFMANLLMVYE